MDHDDLWTWTMKKLDFLELKVFYKNLFKS